MKYLSLFSGIGGFEMGMPTDWESIGFSELNKYASSIYKLHYPNHQELGDATRIRTRDLDQFEILVGGFPCQAFSIAGQREGFQDHRGTLFFEIARILADKRPRYFLLENVPNLLSHDDGKTFTEILRVCAQIGYDVQWDVLNSKDFGVPQQRKRIFLIGSIRESSRPEIFPFEGADFIFDES
ncbi:TPA: DNA (cytosine-5-)-methyltransferase, partial [Candidatus Woesearchaeota archaeon]|nr:DNA (cytosine-5-)-methyltransferase [Candidatus Woesearchaeota archaeon]